MVAVQTEQMEETMDVGFNVIRDGVQNLAWWSRVITTLIMLRLIFWVIVGRNFTLSDLNGSKWWFMLCGFLERKVMQTDAACS